MQEELIKIEDWRLQVLLEAGYPMVLAELLARDNDIDLHRAVELLEHGCKPETAAKILL